jgi:hypothetical protein
LPGSCSTSSGCPSPTLIQAYYLIEHTHDLPWWGTSGIVLLSAIGYVIFRGANIQKHKFHKNPGRIIWGKPAEFIKTARGSLLLTVRLVGDRASHELSGRSGKDWDLYRAKVPYRIVPGVY